VTISFTDYLNINFQSKQPVGSEVVPCGQTEEQTGGCDEGFSYLL